MPLSWKHPDRHVATKPPTSRYFDVVLDANGREVMKVYTDGIALLRLVLINKGTAFTPEERSTLNIDGLLPPAVCSLEDQVTRAYAGYEAVADDLARYQYLRGLQERQEILYYALLERHLAEMMPIVYTPTVGEAVKKFSKLYQNPRGLTLAPGNIKDATRVVANYPLNDVRMIVATDSSAILGIGDQGWGGLAIPIGKLSLYTVGGGVSPFQTMPVSLDVGTDRQDLIDDPLYLGTRQKRLKGAEYLEFVDRFVQAVRARWPNAVIQWEDLSKDTAFTVLDRYRKVIPSFNDDVQGTGAVALAGVKAACRLSGTKLGEQVIVIHGAGAGGGGVAWALREGMVRDGLSREEASKRLWLLDSRGLLTTDRELEAYKRPFAQEAPKMATLLEVVKHSKATVLLGLSGQPGAFDEATVAAMAKNTARPIIFPLSNPTSSTEAAPVDIRAWSKGTAIVAAGSPFPDTAQGNNAFIFPGLGQGAILARAREITDGMVLEASDALDEYTAAKHPTRVYPPIDELREVSEHVAVRVIQQAVADGVAMLPDMDEGGLEKAVHDAFWHPRYLPIVKG